MKPAPFEYHRATSVQDAVETLRSSDGEGKLIAGGQSLVPLLALRLARPGLLVDINRVPGLAAIESDGGDVVRIGALVRHRRLETQTDHPLLAAAAGFIGHAAIRSRGTFGGSVAHADPAAELPVVMIACDGEALVTGPEGTRTVAARDLLIGPLTVDLAPEELITGARLRVPARHGFAEFARRHGDFALVIAAVARLTDGPRVVIGGTAGTPQRATEAEALLAAEARPSSAALDAAAALAAENLPTSGDLHGSAEYRRALARVQTRAALQSAYDA